jgi:plastocyanin
VRRLLTAATLLACLGAGCGDDDEPGRTVTFEQGQTVRVTGSEYEFDPSTVVVRAGRVRIELANEGSLAHNLKLFEGERDLGGTPTFPGGGTEAADVELERGTYRMVCTVGDHEELGMTGTLEAR